MAFTEFCAVPDGVGRRVARRWVVLIMLALTVTASMAAPTAAAALQSTQPDPELVTLFAQWFDAEPDSEAKVAAEKELTARLSESEEAIQDQLLELLRALAEQRLGTDAIELYRQYWGALPGSAEESQALDQFRAEAEKRGLSTEEAERLVRPLVDEPMLEGTSSDLDEIGSAEPLPETEVDVELIVPLRNIVAGELWSVFGQIHNRSSRPIWIVDRFSTLFLPPELYGQESEVGSIGAFFPTVRPRKQDEVVRIDPGMAYTVVWKIDPTSSQRRPASTTFDRYSLVRMVRRIYLAWSNYMFFIPGEYTAAANVHVWPLPPQAQDGQVVNPGDSFTKATTTNVEIEASPWVLISGAVAGGVLAFALQALGSAQRKRRHRTRRKRISALVLGLASALLLTSVVTILLSRLSTSQFLVNVHVRDIWGAMAIGFVVQWFGFSYLERILPKEGEDETPHQSSAVNKPKNGEQKPTHSQTASAEEGALDAAPS